MNRPPINNVFGSITLIALVVAVSVVPVAAGPPVVEAPIIEAQVEDAPTGETSSAAPPSGKSQPPPDPKPGEATDGDASDGSESKDDALKARGPMPPRGLLPYCLRLMKQDRNAEARKLLTPIVADHPGWAKVHFYLGLTYHREHRYQEARRLFQRATELDPGYHAVRVFYGWCLYYLGDLTASRAMFESYLAIKPDYPDAIFALGLIDFDEDDMKSARARFEKTIELAIAKRDAPAQAKALARLADVYVREGELTQAKASLEQSIELNPDNYEPYFKLSRVLQRLGDAEGARRARQMHDTVRQRVHPSMPTPEPAKP